MVEASANRFATRPIIADPSVSRSDLAASLWRHVAKSEGCWLWTGATKGRGYGHFSRRGRWFAAHRVSFELAFGPIPTGLRVLHRCDVPACVRPDHLFTGTGKDNYQDMVSKGRNSSPGAKRNGHAKVGPEQVLLIRARVRKGERKAVLAAEFNLSKSALGKLIRGDTWSKLPDAVQRDDRRRTNVRDEVKVRES